MALFCKSRGSMPEITYIRKTSPIEEISKCPVNPLEGDLCSFCYFCGKECDINQLETHQCQPYDLFCEDVQDNGQNKDEIGVNQGSFSLNEIKLEVGVVQNEFVQNENVDATLSLAEYTQADIESKKQIDEAADGLQNASISTLLTYTGSRQAKGQFCEFCGICSLNPNNFKNHLSTTHKNDSFPCFLCAEDFKNTDELIFHLKVKHYDSDFKKAESDQINQFRNYEKRFVYFCNQCGQGFDHIRSLSQHKKHLIRLGFHRSRDSFIIGDTDQDDKQVSDQRVKKKELREESTKSKKRKYKDKEGKRPCDHRKKRCKKNTFLDKHQKDEKKKSNGKNVLGNASEPCSSFVKITAKDIDQDLSKSCIEAEQNNIKGVVADKEENNKNKKNKDNSKEIFCEETRVTDQRKLLENMLGNEINTGSDTVAILTDMSIDTNLLDEKKEKNTTKSSELTKQNKSIESVHGKNNAKEGNTLANQVESINASGTSLIKKTNEENKSTEKTSCKDVVDSIEKKDITEYCKNEESYKNNNDDSMEKSVKDKVIRKITLREYKEKRLSVDKEQKNIENIQPGVDNVSESNTKQVNRNINFEECLLGIDKCHQNKTITHQNIGELVSANLITCSNKIPDIQMKIINEITQTYQRCQKSINSENAEANASDDPMQNFNIHFSDSDLDSGNEELHDNIMKSAFSSPDSSTPETTPPPPIFCEYCGFPCQTQEILKNHHKFTHPNHNFTCFVCDVTFNNLNAMINHISKHKKAALRYSEAQVLKLRKTVSNLSYPYYCDQCGQGFTLIHLIADHKRNAHKVMIDEKVKSMDEENIRKVVKKRKSNEMKKTTKSVIDVSNPPLPKDVEQNNDLVMTVQKTLKKSDGTIEICESGSQSLNAAKPFFGLIPQFCELCGEKNESSNDLQTHIHINRCFKCIVCCFAFENIQSLTSHYDACHPKDLIEASEFVALATKEHQTNSYPYYCKNCGEGFNFISEMTSHKSISHYELALACAQTIHVSETTARNSDSDNNSKNTSATEMENSNKRKRNSHNVEDNNTFLSNVQNPIEPSTAFEVARIDTVETTNKPGSIPTKTQSSSISPEQITETLDDEIVKIVFCEVCGLKFNTKKDIRQHHFLSHFEKEFRCSVCAFDFEDTSGLISHQDKWHNLAAVKYAEIKSFKFVRHRDAFRYYCKHCGYAFGYIFDLKKHKISVCSKSTGSLQETALVNNNIGVQNSTVVSETVLSSTDVGETVNLTEENICADCGASFYSNCYLLEHQSKCLKPNKLGLCKSSATESNHFGLTDHKTSRTNNLFSIPPFSVQPLPQINKTIPNPLAVEKTSINDRQNKHFRCAVCPNRYFVNKLALRQHSMTNVRHNELKEKMKKLKEDAQKLKKTKLSEEVKSEEKSTFSNSNGETQNYSIIDRSPPKSRDHLEARTKRKERKRRRKSNSKCYPEKYLRNNLNQRKECKVTIIEKTKGDNDKEATTSQNDEFANESSKTETTISDQNDTDNNEVIKDASRMGGIYRERDTDVTDLVTSQLAKTNPECVHEEGHMCYSCCIPFPTKEKLGEHSCPGPF